MVTVVIIAVALVALVAVFFSAAFIEVVAPRHFADG